MKFISETQELELDNIDNMYNAKVVQQVKFTKEEIVQKKNQFELLKTQATKNLERLRYLKKNWRKVIKAETEKLKFTLKKQLEGIPNIKNQIKSLDEQLNGFHESTKNDKEIQKIVAEQEKRKIDAKKKMGK